MTKPDPTEDLIRKEAELLQAGIELQGQNLELLLAEMQALAALMPGAKVPGTQLHHPTEAETEEGFDNMPV
ncbi:hypothetical protein [Tabrizicola caldifontis]|uniref:hypothetical protein n=1 Tax=Tabrizicola caldifontis TaxID=2528036 RepID=UPI00107FFBEA|nr:hypothetical protein [Rhodobacter sp. YIM 73028]